MTEINTTLLPDFIIEAAEHLDEIEALLLHLGEDPEDLEVLNDVFRPVHNIKGGAQITGLEKVSKLAHRLEDLLDLLRQGQKISGTEIVDLLIDARDRISLLVNELEQTGEEQTSVDDLVDRLTLVIEQDDEPSSDAYFADTDQVEVVDTVAGLNDEAGEQVEVAKLDEVKEVDGDSELESVSNEETNDEAVASAWDSPSQDTMVAGQLDAVHYDEKHDSELFGIFVEHLREQVEALRRQIPLLHSASDQEQLLQWCADSVHSLWLSANYMGYEELTRLFHSWESEVNNAQQLVADGEIAQLGVITEDLLRMGTLFPQLTDLDDDIDREGDVLSEAFTAMDDDEYDQVEDATLSDSSAVTTNQEASQEESDVTASVLDAFDAMDTDEEPVLSSNSATEAEPAEEEEKFSNMNMSLLPDFIVEAMEHLEEIETLLLHLGDDPNNMEVLNDIFRPVHNIKGGSQITGLKKISRLAHRWEDLLDMLRQGEKQCNSEIVDLLIDTRDRIVLLVDELENFEREESSVEELVLRLTQTIEADPASAATGTAQTETVQSATTDNEINSNISYDEEYDQELFGIFLDHMREQLSIITDKLALMATTDAREAEYQICFDCVNHLWAAANYMDYGQLTQLYKNWGGELDQARQACAAGRSVEPGFIQSYLDELVTIFPQLTEQDTPVPTAEAIATVQAPESKPAVAIIEETKSPVVEPSSDAYPEVEHPLSSELEERLTAALDNTAAPGSNAETLNQVYDELVTGASDSRKQTTNAAAIQDSEQNRAKLQLEQKQTADKRKSGEGDKKIKKSMRVDAEKIDTLMNQVGELVVDRSYFFQLFNEMRGLQQYLKDVPGLDQKDIKMVRTLTYRLGEAIAALGRTSNELQEGVMKMRMLPISHIFNRYPRLVRDLTHGTDKKVNLVIRGEETELDKMIVEELSDPLIHIIRNAVDHGLESMDERKSRGKSESGTLELEAYQESNHIVIEVIDDGRGIDPDKIKRKAVEKGLYNDEELERMAPRDLTQLILAPGFSTAEKITGTSGRGVGMDVVKRNIEKLNGTLDIDSKPGVRTLMRLKIPLTLAIIHALMVRVGEDLFTIPLANVDETVRIFGDETSTVEGVEVIHLRGRALPMFRLSKLFNIPGDTDTNKSFVVIVSTEGQRTGFVVDELIGQEEVVIKPLADYVQEKSGFSGATIVGDGRISLILDAYELVKMTSNRQARKHKAQAIELRSRIKRKPGNKNKVAQ